MSTFLITMIVGWSAVILSVVMPKFVKDETDKAVLGIGLSAFLLGAFVCGLIDMFVNYCKNNAFIASLCASI